MGRRIFAYLFHLAIAAVAVPILAMVSSALICSLLTVNSAANPQSFYSDHIIALAGVTGLWLGYFVYEHVSELVCSVDLDSVHSRFCSPYFKLESRRECTFPFRSCWTLFPSKLPDAELD